MSVNDHQKNIEQLFKNSEHSKELPVSSQLWERLESKIDLDDYKGKTSRLQWITRVASAACVVFLLGFVCTYQNMMTSSQTFLVQDMVDFEEYEIYQVSSVQKVNQIIKTENFQKRMPYLN